MLGAAEIGGGRGRPRRPLIRTSNAALRASAGFGELGDRQGDVGEGVRLVVGSA
jgi:hypothetical protein